MKWEILHHHDYDYNKYNLVEGISAFCQLEYCRVLTEMLGELC